MLLILGLFVAWLAVVFGLTVLLALAVVYGYYHGYVRAGRDWWDAYVKYLPPARP